ncbi:MAG: nucleotidyl transferase AbiEii/AbiGii toxin family protein [Actinobacteria bacterium]|nr:nucleotidyl transferase AbiEii/AbiGii toxin family protein [Actinomycetota bacterium]
MTRTEGAPINVTSLSGRISNSAGSEGLKLQRIRIMSTVVLAQMMPAGAIKGGTAMKIRMGESTTRFSSDLDIARAEEMKAFVAELEERLVAGWGGFTGVLIKVNGPFPKGVPTDYLMVPFRVKLSYRGSSWTSVILEVGNDEIGDTKESELHMAPEIVELFASIGLPIPNPVALLAPKHQIAQKLHAASSTGNQRAHDLVDLQLLETHESFELAEVKDTCERLFRFRGTHAWPPTFVEYENWNTLYQEAAQGIPVLQGVTEAVIWANEFVARIFNA